MSLTAPPHRFAPAQITVVTSPGCHFCQEALALAEELGREFPLQVRAVGAGTPDGMALVQGRGVGKLPVVLLDDHFVSAGQLPRPLLRALLEARVRRLGHVAKLDSRATTVAQSVT